MAADLEVKLKAPSGLEFTQPTGLFINNEYVPSQSGETLDVIDPATGKVITKVYAADEKDVDIAVAAARKVFKDSWRNKVACHERGALMAKLVQLLKRDAELLATVEAWDAGKAHKTQATGEIAASIAVYNYYAGWCDKLGAETVDVGPAKFAYTLREPMGVCGQIIPWNYPFLMAAWKIAPALATGNVVVLKTAENTPLSMLHFGKLVKEAGFPPGVVNIITGYGAKAGAPLAAHMDVDKIAFTGSTLVGKQIMKLASTNMKNVTLECGGKSPMIIFDDADIEQAANYAHQALMANQGQTCTALSRYYVQEGIYDKFIEAFKKVTLERSKVGNPFDEGTFQGPQVSKVQQDRVLGYIKAGQDEGARVVMGGGRPQGLDDGFYVEPTIFADVKDDMKIMREEIFGPVASVAKFSTEADAVERANDSQYGLGASIFTRDVVRAHRVARLIESGQVWVNSGNDPDYRMPFGGYKSSGIGRELGKYGLEIYTQIKAVHVNMRE